MKDVCVDPSNKPREDCAHADMPKSHREPVGTLSGNREQTMAAGGGNPPVGYRFSPGTWLRRMLAAALVGLAVWWLVLPMFVPITSEAVVNARLAQVRAPIDGTATRLHFDLGETVEAGQALFCLENQALETSELIGLKTRHAELCARRARLERELEEMVRAEEVCKAQVTTYQGGRVALLKATLLEGGALVDVAKTHAVAAQKHLNRVEHLAKARAASTSELESARDNEAVARKRIQVEEASVAKIKEELNAAVQGMYLRYETPFFVQRLEDLTLKIPQTRASLKETQDFLASVAAELTCEQERVKRLSKRIAVAPVTGLVWTRTGNQGQVVKKNEAMYEIADQSTIFVEAFLHQRHLSSVAPNSQATIVLTGGQTLAGWVKAVRTPGPTDSEISFALRLNNNDVKMGRVLIGFDAKSTPDPSLIGRHVRVLLTDPDPNLLQRTMAWLFSRVGA